MRPSATSISDLRGLKLLVYEALRHQQPGKRVVRLVRLAGAAIAQKRARLRSEVFRSMPSSSPTVRKSTCTQPCSSFPSALDAHCGANAAAVAVAAVAVCARRRAAGSRATTTGITSDAAPTPPDSLCMRP